MISILCLDSLILKKKRFKLHIVIFDLDFGLVTSFICDPSLNEGIQLPQYISNQNIPQISKLCIISLIVPRTTIGRWDMCLKKKKLSYLYSSSMRKEGTP